MVVMVVKSIMATMVKKILPYQTAYQLTMFIMVVAIILAYFILDFKLVIIGAIMGAIT